MCTRSLVKSFKKKHPSEAAVPLLVQLECIDLAAVTIQGPKGRAREAGSDPLKIPPNSLVLLRSDRLESPGIDPIPLNESAANTKDGLAAGIQVDQSTPRPWISCQCLSLTRIRERFRSPVTLRAAAVISCSFLNQSMSRTWC